LPVQKGQVFFMGKLEDQIQTHYQTSLDSLATKRVMWDEAESIFSNKLNDAISSKTKSQVMDQKLSTMILEREARVMSKLPIGKFRPISGDDIASTQIINLIMEKYIIPNAKAQFPFLTKLRMMDRYSNIYGNMFAMVDWDIKKNGYVGPDLWLLAIRDVFPQVGAVSLDDSDRIVIRTWKPISYFEGLGKGKNLKNVGNIVEKLKKLNGDKSSKSSSEQSVRETQQQNDTQEGKGSGYFQVLTMFERDRWVDYVPAAHLVLRDIENPNKDGELPIVCKYSIPLIDDFMGMGDMERGKTMQYTLNSLWNLYLDAIKISIFPPTILNKDNIIASTIKWGAGAKWLVRNSVGNSVQQLAINPRGIDSFQSTYQTLNASLLNMFGTTDTSTTAATDPGFGKTPQALQMQQSRESAKDNVDRFYMEQTLSDIMRKFANLWSKKQPSSTVVRMFSRELEDLIRVYPEAKDMYNVDTGKLTLNKKITGSTLYDYEIVPGSTYAINEEKQQGALREMFAMLSQGLTLDQQGKVTSPLMKKMEEEGKKVQLGELFTRIISGSGIMDWSKIVVDSQDAQQSREVTPQEQQSMQADQEQFLQMLQGIQGGQGGQINQIPPQDPLSPQMQMGQQMPGQGGPMQQAAAPPQVPQMGGQQLNGQG